ncbi:hypothetical protein [Natrialba sp. SSL1]|uniref:hypothetical protein n=1 Tax=Natrialba sp. SSL1 TaxID=1869245 RepID=UPI0008F922F1|nr:hypothetical protein [Natrialba sp. SSL1]OIB58834.1 hypothetical protein BBD46_06415 [Natrialba sp. SSL1]
MREPAEWMNPSTDDAILESLRDNGNQQPVHVANKIGRHRKYVGERLRELAKYGLVENLGQGLYRITDTGEGYLEGEFDASELECNEA